MHSYDIQTNPSKSNYIKETQLSSNDYPFRSRQAGTALDGNNQFDVKSAKPRASAEAEERSSEWRDPTQNKTYSSRKISYE
jgi:hypothetical protein